MQRVTEREKGTNGEKEIGRTRRCLQRNSCANQKWATKKKKEYDSGSRDRTGREKEDT